MPVPVAVPTYYDNHHRDDFDGYDYTHPHVQYRKDMEELKEWGIEPYDEPHEESSQQLNRVVPAPNPAAVPGLVYPGSYRSPQYTSNTKPIAYIISR